MIRSNDFERQVSTLYTFCIFKPVCMNTKILFKKKKLFQIEEIEIPVPWGHIAAKWWGPTNVRPILCVHGWQDNCGSFDPLIYQLPDHVSYLAIDLPGHGRSSRIGDGMLYSLEFYFYSVMLICDYYRWEKVSLMAHSLGSVVAFLYASAFPNKCDMLIGLDTLRPFSNIFPLVYRRFTRELKQSHEADMRNRQNKEPPSYTYDELFEKIKSGISMQITIEAAPYILQRSVLPSAIRPNKYYFSRDSRVKSSTVPLMAHDMAIKFAAKITAPYCFVKSSWVAPAEYLKHYNEVIEIMRRNPQFEMHSVVGHHHVHLNEPDKVSGFISTFIHKHRSELVASKL